MRLEVGSIFINDVQFADKTEVKNGTLYVNKDELASIAGDDERIKSVEVFLARPGEAVRIIPVNDLVQPRCTVDGPGAVFAGFLSDVKQLGRGTLPVL